MGGLFGDEDERPKPRLDAKPLLLLWEQFRSGQRGLPKQPRYPVEVRAFRLVWEACGYDADLLLRALRWFTKDNRRLVREAGWPIGIFVSQRDGYIEAAMAERAREAEARAASAPPDEPVTDPAKVAALAKSFAASLPAIPKREKKSAWDEKMRLRKA